MTTLLPPAARRTSGMLSRRMRSCRSSSSSVREFNGAQQYQHGHSCDTQELLEQCYLLKSKMITNRDEPRDEPRDEYRACGSKLVDVFFEIYGLLCTLYGLELFFEFFKCGGV